MSKTSFRKTQPHRLSARKTGLALALSLACSLFVGSANAQWAVIDVASITQNQSGFAAQLAKTVDQYTTQLQQYQQEVQQYQQLLMSVQGLGTNISFTSNKLSQITDPSMLIEQNCPGTSGGSVVGSLVTSLSSTISASQPITTSQQQICANIVTVEIDEYNKTVIIVNQLNQYGGTLQKLNALANQVNTLGATSGATTQAATYSASMATNMAQWQASIAGDKALVDSLNQQQAILSKVALKGSNTVLGNVVQAAALKAAFTVNQ
jgi:hypothetical protein